MQFNYSDPLRLFKGVIYLGYFYDFLFTVLLFILLFLESVEISYVALFNISLFECFSSHIIEFELACC